jgi:hypothetical protein
MQLLGKETRSTIWNWSSLETGPLKPCGKFGTQNLYWPRDVARVKRLSAGQRKRKGKRNDATPPSGHAHMRLKDIAVLE